MELLPLKIETKYQESFLQPHFLAETSSKQRNTLKARNRTATVLYIPIFNKQTFFTLSHVEKSYWAIVSVDGIITQTPDSRSAVVGNLQKGAKVCIADQTSYALKIVKPNWGWIEKELIQHFVTFHGDSVTQSIFFESGWYSLTRDVVVIVQRQHGHQMQAQQSKKSLFGGSFVHISAVQERTVIIDEPVQGRFNCSPKERAVVPVELKVSLEISVEKNLSSQNCSLFFFSLPQSSHQKISSFLPS